MMVTPALQADEQRASRGFSGALYMYALALSMFDGTIEALEEAVTYMEGNGGWNTVLQKEVPA